MVKRRKPNRSKPMSAKVVIEISPSSPAEKDPKRRNKEGAEEVDDGTPLRPIFCLKNKIDMKRIEEMDDCFILDFNPYDSIDISKLSVAKDADHLDVSVLAEKGQVACRDYPHSRHLCSQFPFNTTAHEKYCDLCYCYVCDSAAPCELWKTHCDASDHVGVWKHKRMARRARIRSQQKLRNSFFAAQ